MVGIIAVSHGSFAVELIRSVEMIWGKQDRIEAIALGEGESLESLEAKLSDGMEKLGNGEALILVDMLGGTPFNATSVVLGNPKVNIVTGLNMPMLLALLNKRDESLEIMTAEAIEAGRKGIVDVRAELKKVKVFDGPGI